MASWDTKGILGIRYPEDTGASWVFQHLRTPPISSGYRGILRILYIGILGIYTRCPEDTGGNRYPEDAIGVLGMPRVSC